MKTEIRCDRCGNSFMGEEWLLEKNEVLCPDCYKEERKNDDLFI